MRISKLLYSTKRPANARAVDFRLTAGQARDSLSKTRTSRFAQTVQLHPDDEASVEYLPFHVFSFKCTARYSAQIGHDYTSNEYNLTKKKYEQIRRTEWSSTERVHETHWSYGPEETDVNQVYASFKYNMDQVSPLKVSNALTVSRPISESYITNKVVGNFDMYRTRAWEIVASRVHKSETEKAQKALKEEYNCDHVAHLDLELIFHQIHHDPIYFPGYVFHVRHFGIRFPRFVSGYNDGRIGGEVLYSESKVASACMATYASAHMIWALSTTDVKHSMMPDTVYDVPSFVLPVIGVGILGSITASYKPLVALLWSERSRRKQEQLNLDHRARPQTDTQEAQYTSRSSSDPSARAWSFPNPLKKRVVDPKGYYAILGVQPNATDDEIKKSFRTRALETHPDTKGDPIKKHEAAERFRILQEAYGVLRDKTKRKKYDGRW
eukprot:CFRG0445T1